MPKKTQEASVAPKERVNIVYKPATGDAKQGVELPFRMVVLGDFTKAEDERAVEEREPVEVNESNFDDVMDSMDLKLQFSVANRLTNNPDEELPVELELNELKDFEPDHLVESVPELKRVLELRKALKALKGPIGNVPAVRKALQQMLSEDDKRAKLMKELGVE